MRKKLRRQISKKLKEKGLGTEVSEKRSALYAALSEWREKYHHARRGTQAP